MRICKIVPEKEDNKYLGEFELSEEEIESIALNNAHIHSLLSTFNCKRIKDGRHETLIIFVAWSDHRSLWSTNSSRHFDALHR
jgi:hypothetical protein